MKCKHSTRSAWTKNISDHSDDYIAEEIRGHRVSFASGAQVGRHHMQVWRQIYLAEARKRGLET